MGQMRSWNAFSLLFLCSPSSSFPTFSFPHFQSSDPSRESSCTVSILCAKMWLMASPKFSFYNLVCSTSVALELADNGFCRTVFNMKSFPVNVSVTVISSSVYDSDASDSLNQVCMSICLLLCHRVNVFMPVCLFVSLFVCLLTRLLRRWQMNVFFGGICLGTRNGRLR